MQKKIVSTCSPNNNMYLVGIQYIVKKFPDGLFLVTSYIWRIDYAHPLNTTDQCVKINQWNTRRF